MIATSTTPEPSRGGGGGGGAAADLIQAALDRRRAGRAAAAAKEPVGRLKPNTSFLGRVIGQVERGNHREIDANERAAGVKAGPCTAVPCLRNFSSQPEPCHLWSRGDMKLLEMNRLDTSKMLKSS